MSVGTGPAPGPAPNAPNTVTGLVLGILSVVLCPLLGPFAWSFGRKGEQAVDDSGGTLGGRGIATAGKVLGIIGTLFLLLLVVLLIVVAIGGEVEGDLTVTTDL